MLTTRGLPVLGSVVEELKAGSDVVVVAGPPLLGPNGGVAIATVVDFVIVVVSAKTKREELHETKWRLGEMGVGVLGAVMAQQMSRHRIRHLRRTSREDADAAANTTLVDAGVGQNGRIRSDRPLPDEPLELRRPAGGTGTRTPRRSSRAGRTSGFSGPSTRRPPERGRRFRPSPANPRNVRHNSRNQCPNALFPYAERLNRLHPCESLFPQASHSTDRSIPRRIGSKSDGGRAP